MIFRTAFVASCLVGVALSRSDFDANALRYRDLSAARRHEDVVKRSPTIETRTSIVLNYAEAGQDQNEEVFAARVRLGGDRPTLLLEEFDHLLDTVECSRSSMTLTFRDISHLQSARLACTGIHDGLVVSSHSSCSQAGAHSVFKITDIEYQDSTSKMVLYVEETTWTKAFRSKKIEFGHSTERHYAHRHDRLGRRQAERVAPGGIASAATSLIPTASATAESVTYDLSNEQVETTFELPGDVQLGPSIPFELGCKKCSTKGQLILTQGEIDFTDIDELTGQFFDQDQEMDFIKSGFFQLEMNGFESSILLKAIPSASGAFAIDLFQVPVFGFKIPGFGSAGVLFQPQIVFDIDVRGGVELNWGFKVNVPDKSTIRLDVGQFNKSLVTGFDKTKVETLPFNANASDIELTLQAGLRPFLPIGMSFFDDRLQLLGGPYLDLPYISTTIKQLTASNVNEKCETNKGLGDEKLKSGLQNLTHITSELGMGAGFEFEAAVDIPGPVNANKLYNYTIWSTSAPLPTACFGFKENKMVQLNPTGAASRQLPSFIGGLGQTSMLALCFIATVFVAL